MRVIGSGMVAALLCLATQFPATSARGEGIDDLLKVCPSVNSYEQYTDSKGALVPGRYALYTDEAKSRSLEFYVKEAALDSSVKYLWISGKVKSFSAQPSSDVLASISKLNEDPKVQPGSLSLYEGKNSSDQAYWTIFFNVFAPGDIADAKTLDAYISMTEKLRTALETRFMFLD